MRKMIDAHMHAFSSKVATGKLNVRSDQIELADRVEMLLHEMDAHGAEMACLHQATLERETPLIQAAVRKYPKRFVGFCCWKMGSTGMEAAEFVQKWLREPEFKGVGEALIKKFLIKGKVETIPAALKELRMAMDVIRQKKIPILFHTGFAGSPPIGSVAAPLSWADPLSLDEIAMEYRDVPIIIGHTGGHYPPYDVNALMMAYQYENIYLDTSKSRTDIIEKAVFEIGSSRMIFGTDWVREEPHPIGPTSERPTKLYEWNINIIERAKISDQDKENIFYKNFRSLLRL